MRVTGAVFLFFLLASIPVFFLAESHEQIDLFGNVAQLTAVLFAGFSFLNAWDAAKNPVIQKAGIMIASGMLIWAIGQVMVTYSELLLHRSPYGTVSSVFFVIGNALCLLAMLAVVRHSLKVSHANPALKNTILLTEITVLVLIFFVVLLNWHLLEDPERNIVWKVLDLLYPLFDLSILALTVILLRYAWLRKDFTAFKGYAFFCLAFLTICFADMVAIDVDFEKLVYRAVDTVYFSAYFFIAISGHFLARTSREHPVADKSV
jgi:hypothetical protein